MMTSSQPVAGDLTAAPFIEEAEAWLLNGERLPPDYRQRLFAMAPGPRMEAIIWLRRSGLLIDRVWSVDDLMRPASSASEDVGDDRPSSGS